MRLACSFGSLLAALLVQDISAFAPSSGLNISPKRVIGSVTIQQPDKIRNNAITLVRTSNAISTQFPIQMANISEEETTDNFQINPLFATLWAGFFLFGILQTAGEGVGSGTPSQELIERYIANPSKPDLNEIFNFIFNLLGLAPLIAASLIMPGAKFQKLPATPFLIGSAALGYGALGVYMTGRVPAKNVSKSDLGWFTSNVLENKLFNSLLVLVGGNLLFQLGGALSADAQGVINGFVDLTSHAAVALVSSIDLCILTLTLSILVAEDLERRGVEDKQAITAISASTLLLPIIGASIYCALRPSLPEGE
mmetsp:Transcript_9829/g.9497  ORF Transcript_9829/g.9497 Transcript_9829/m.9497 type:complete len:311 (-) Transcript_9829:242-1174(-)|eukprot:CAMPEP_0197835252 /NCGR_PEP_ID=MMETSP1437-20131217/25230_1 /TAXON_ID=49252 ORGANISM="Eucampia antarctica, Strain CCMP1452" /NCGR_SAMPLE_ID=MMETSP1437 /ASSEMBLY_ACC=CAM_ASM_001096 /LENGTH=310 /DNA_ID=CAMNT_0043440537 /DNA_START=123 /DNA_END=1055 /DNA_ORIENTATION=+